MTEETPALDNFTDAAAQQSLHRALHTGAVIALLALPLFWWKTGWQGALMFAVGAVISLSGLWEWRRLITVILARLSDAAPDAPRPAAVGPVAAGFFFRLTLAVAVLYVSLKYLHGSVPALVAGLASGVAALTIEALRLLKAWTH